MSFSQLQSEVNLRTPLSLNSSSRQKHLLYRTPTSVYFRKKPQAKIIFGNLETIHNQTFIGFWKMVFIDQM